jgi:hypothetical protein
MTSLQPTPSEDTGQTFLHARSSGKVDLFLNEGERYEFDYQEPHVVHVLLEAARTTDTQFWTRYEVRSTREISRAAQIQLVSLAAGRLPRGSRDHSRPLVSPDGSSRSFPNVAADGTFDSALAAPHELLSDEMQALFRPPLDASGTLLRRTINVLRWRTGRMGDPPVFSESKSEWSVDSVTWRVWPVEIRAEFSSFSAIRLASGIREFIEARVGAGSDEPIGHELLREALSVGGTNERSACVLAVAAYEAGVKGCIAGLAPDTKWLIENLQAPPVMTLLRKYIPLLLSTVAPNITVGVLPSTLRKVLDDGVLRRNKIVHAGADAAPYDELRELLVAVEDVLWLLDYYQGELWALRNVRPETLTAMGINNQGQSLSPGLPHL